MWSEIRIGYAHFGDFVLLLRRQDGRIWRIFLRASAFRAVVAETFDGKTEGVDISVWNMGVGLSAYSDKGSST